MPFLSKIISYESYPSSIHPLSIINKRQFYSFRNVDSIVSSSNILRNGFTLFKIKILCFSKHISWEHKKIRYFFKQQVVYSCIQKNCISMDKKQSLRKHQGVQGTQKEK